MSPGGRQHSGRDRRRRTLNRASLTEFLANLRSISMSDQMGFLFIAESKQNLGLFGFETGSGLLLVCCPVLRSTVPPKGPKKESQKKFGPKPDRKKKKYQR